MIVHAQFQFLIASPFLFARWHFVRVAWHMRSYAMHCVAFAYCTVSWVSVLLRWVEWSGVEEESGFVSVSVCCTRFSHEFDSFVRLYLLHWVLHWRNWMDGNGGSEWANMIRNNCFVLSFLTVLPRLRSFVRFITHARVCVALKQSRLIRSTARLCCLTLVRSYHVGWWRILGCCPL